MSPSLGGEGEERLLRVEGDRTRCDESKGNIKFIQVHLSMVRGEKEVSWLAIRGVGQELKLHRSDEVHCLLEAINSFLSISQDDLDWRKALLKCDSIGILRGRESGAGPS